ncbi:MAG: ArsA family ATPase, partial [candidate division Zixibacteria bacterium]|nr:ArsA family ATPase [candidate division Zixibacteria bacterium]NIT60756.1 ArsA family ATPase [Fodinibius sp.]
METNNSKTSKRIILFTGKGGVGKTSVAAATALRCSKLGYKTIVLS